MYSPTVAELAKDLFETPDTIQRLMELAELLEVNIYDVSVSSYARYGYPIFMMDTITDAFFGYLVLTDDEASCAAKDGVADSLWELSAEFLEEQIGILDFARLVKPAKEKDLGDEINPALLDIVQATCGLDALAEAAIAAYGRGRFLATCDGEEYKTGEFFIYAL